jgi:holin-like protein
MPAFNTRTIALTSRRYLRHSRPLQIALICVMWRAATAVVQLLGLPFPPGIVGMMFALVLLATCRISLFTLRRGAK